MVNLEEPKTVWDWLESKGWMYLPIQYGYQSPCGKMFITHTSVYAYPGDVINYLKTGFIRNVNMFELSWGQQNHKRLGLYLHKDKKTAVSLTRIK